MKKMNSIYWILFIGLSKNMHYTEKLSFLSIIFVLI